jgi:hypothetical protein
MSGFSIRNPHFIIVICLALMAVGMVSMARMPVDLFPAINMPEVVVATFYSRHAAGGHRVRHHQSAGAVLSRWPAAWTTPSRARCWASASSSLLSAGNQRRRRCDATLQPGAGRPEALAARHPAAGGAEVRRLQPAGLPGDGQRAKGSTRRNFTTTPNSRSATRSPW